MDAPGKPAPALTDRAAAAQRAQAEREAAALRENLRRRKAQSRARGDAPAADSPQGDKIAR